MDRLTILKIGGNVVDNPQLLDRLLNDFVRITGYKILIHGGGKLATALANRLGVKTQMVDGRRITDEAMLEIVTMVYGGLVNKQIVAGLQARNCNALGLTGVDLSLMHAQKRLPEEIDYGLVGDINSVNTRELRMLLGESVVPVVAPLTHNGQGQILNTNADTVASQLAIDLALHFSVLLFYCFEKPGVLLNADDDSSIITELSPAKFEELQQEGVINSGMIPKIQNGFNALNKGVNQVIIANPEGFVKTRGTRLVQRKEN
ncbi:MAG: acetylglutamate kinase [Prolixibacteraceae bacterium]|nr:acetylglutamate kinase [Prolixibacteraceae bacterium]